MSHFHDFSFVAKKILDSVSSTGEKDVAGGYTFITIAQIYTSSKISNTYFGMVIANCCLIITRVDVLDFNLTIFIGNKQTSINVL